MQGMPFEQPVSFKPSAPPEIAPELTEKAYADAIRAQALAQIAIGNKFLGKT